MTDLDELVKVLDLETVAEGRFRGQNFVSGLGGVVFGGQLLAQSIVAAATVDPTKEVKSIHTVFARGGAPDQPLDIDVDTMHVGRALASATVTVRQGERLCTRSLVLLSAVEPDLIRHAADDNDSKRQLIAALLTGVASLVISGIAAAQSAPAPESSS